MSYEVKLAIGEGREQGRERDGPRVEKGQRSTIKREGGSRESNARMAEEVSGEGAKSVKKRTYFLLAYSFNIGQPVNSPHL